MQKLERFIVSFVRGELVFIFFYRDVG